MIWTNWKVWFAAIAAVSLVGGFTSCEKHEWETTKVLYEKHGEDHGSAGDHDNHEKDGGHHDKDGKDHGDHKEGEGDKKPH